MSSEAVAGNIGYYPDKVVAAVSKAADLLEAGYEGRGDEVVRILDDDLELIRVGDLNGDTVLHLLVSGGYVEPLLQLLRFMLCKNPYLLKEVAKQGNAHGDTPLLLAVNNGHKRIENILVKVEGESFHIENDDGESPQKSADEIWCWGWCWDWCWHYYESLLNKGLSTVKEKEIPQCQIGFSDVEMEIPLEAILESDIYKGKISEMMEDPNLIGYRNHRGDTIIHELAFFENVDILTKLVGHPVNTNRMIRHDNEFQLPTSSLLLEGNICGWTRLHVAINRGNMKASRYLIEVAPEAAYRVDNDGESPFYVAIKQGHDELVKYILQVMPEASMSPATRSSLLNPNKSSLLHAAIRFRNFNMLQLLLESIPSLIDSLDEKGWKPLSYAAYKGYLDDVHYLLNKFPESVKKFDSDGSLPIHKAVSGGHVCIIKEFISIHPKTLYSIDKKGRNILHIAVKCRKSDILRYLRDEVSGVEKLYELRDNDGNTFVDYAPRNN